MDVIIFGAQGMALGTYNAMREICPEKNVRCFLVSVAENNPSTLGGLSVRVLSEFALTLKQEEKNNIEVIIATPENVMNEIEDNLYRLGFYKCTKLDSVKWARLQERAFAKNKKYIPITEYQMGVEEPKIKVYMAKYWKDKKIVNDYTIPEYLIPIQVGSAHTDVRVTEVQDNSGDNISEKNGDYSELTALYWIWKNQILADENRMKNYYGLAHYRRFLMLTKEDLLRIKNNDIDVVLPYPMPYEPNIEVHHERYLDSEEWDSVLITLKELQPEYAVGLTEILKQSYFYNYNIIIAKGIILAEYCEWLFPLLFEIEKINNPDGKRKPKRYIGYIAETLETLYFMQNKDKLNIAHAGCKFLL